MPRLRRYRVNNRADKNGGWSAKQRFKLEVREPAEQIVRMNAKNVIAFAEYLREKRFVDGAKAKKIILSAGELTTGDVLSRYDL